MPMLSIGKLAAAANVKVPTIRYYEQIGLLPLPERTESDRRIYDQRSLDRLTFIKRARHFRFSLDAIRRLILMADTPERVCPTANALANAQLAAIEEKIHELNVLRGELQTILSKSCKGRVANCCILETFDNLGHKGVGCR